MFILGSKRINKQTRLDLHIPNKELHKYFINIIKHANSFVLRVLLYLYVFPRPIHCNTVYEYDLVVLNGTPFGQSLIGVISNVIFCYGFRQSNCKCQPPFVSSINSNFRWGLKLNGICRAPISGAIGLSNVTTVKIAVTI